MRNVYKIFVRLLQKRAHWNVRRNIIFKQIQDKRVVNMCGLVLIMEMAAVMDVAPCSVVDVERRFRGAYCLHYQGDKVV
jgi:hypothetical protein